MQWNFYKNFVPLTDKIEGGGGGADLVRTITSLESYNSCMLCVPMFNLISRNAERSRAYIQSF